MLGEKLYGCLLCTRHRAAVKEEATGRRGEEDKVQQGEKGKEEARRKDWSEMKI